MLLCDRSEYASLLLARQRTPMSARILHVVTNVSHYDDPSHATGLWLSELTHAYNLLAEQGYRQRIVSPKRGESPLEPRALK
jgi:hypothetical protein